MRVRWTIVVEGATLAEMKMKAEYAFAEWTQDARFKDGLPPLEPIFLDAEMDEDVLGSYRAWASRNFEVEDR